MPVSEKEVQRIVGSVDAAVERPKSVTTENVKAWLKGEDTIWE